MSDYKGMSNELKAKYLAALRSGEFKQHHGDLRNDTQTAFCCLGVLCVVAGLEIKANGHLAVAPLNDQYSPFAELIGDRALVTKMWHMNDGAASENRRHSFNEIADYFEEHAP